MAAVTMIEFKAHGDLLPENKSRHKFRAPDMVGRKPVRFLLQESTGFSIPADSKSGQFKVRTLTGIGKAKPVATSGDGQERHRALPIERNGAAKIA
jgi:hypothetical protein